MNTPDTPLVSDNDLQARTNEAWFMVLSALGWWLWDRTGRDEANLPEDETQREVVLAMDAGLKEAFDAQPDKTHDEVLLEYLAGVVMNLAQYMPKEANECGVEEND